MAQALADPPEEEELVGEVETEQEEAESPPVALAPPGDGDDDPPDCPKCVKGAPAWLATFGDLMSLLVAFFVLILSFSDINVPKAKQISGSMKEAFGIQRLVPVVEPPKATSLIAKEFSPTVSQPTPMQTIRQQTTDDMQRDIELRTETQTEDFTNPEDAAMLEQMLAEEIRRGEVEIRVDGEMLVVEMRAPDSAGGREAGEDGSRSGGMLSEEQRETFAKIAEAQLLSETPIVVSQASTGTGDAGDGSGREAQAQDIFEQLRADLSNEIAQGLADVEKVGDQVIVRLADQGSFTSGRADLQPGFLPLLRRTGQAVMAGGGRVSIHGHTDNVPVVFNERFRSNWDLSAARAASVADFFIDEFGVEGARMSVSGFADSEPLASNATPEGRAQNRRIEIIVEPA